MRTKLEELIFESLEKETGLRYKANEWEKIHEYSDIPVFNGKILASIDNDAGKKDKYLVIIGSDSQMIDIEEKVYTPSLSFIINGKWEFDAFITAFKSFKYPSDNA